MYLCSCTDNARMHVCLHTMHVLFYTQCTCLFTHSALYLFTNSASLYQKLSVAEQARSKGVTKGEHIKSDLLTFTQLRIGPRTSKTRQHTEYALMQISGRICHALAVLNQ